LITNSGTDKSLSQALFGIGSEITQFGASYAVSDGCYMRVKNEWTEPPIATNSCDVVVNIIVASSFKNNRSIEKCQPSLDFGGGPCEPDPTT